MNWTEVMDFLRLYLVIYAVLGPATFFHELGHYAAARAQGVAVKVFSVGLSPTLLRLNWRGTQWRLGLLPLGGYVEIDGMSPREHRERDVADADSGGSQGGGQAEPTPPAGVGGSHQDVHDSHGSHSNPDRHPVTDPEENPVLGEAAGSTPAPPHGFRALPTWGRLLVLVAGPVMNLLLGVVLLTTLLVGLGRPMPGQAQVQSVQAGSPAEQAGFRAGDIITALDGQPQPGWVLVDVSVQYEGTHTYTVRRADTEQVLTATWQADQPTGLEVGAGLAPETVTGALGRALSITAQLTPKFMQYLLEIAQRFLTFNLGSGSIFSEIRDTTEQLIGHETSGVWSLVLLVALFNLATFYFNLMPVPPLDGGRMLLTAIGHFRGQSFERTWGTWLLMLGTLLMLLFFVWQVAAVLFQ